MYEIYFGTAVKKDLKNLPKNISDKVESVFTILSKNPLLGDALKGEFLGYLSYHFKYKNTEYRIIYEIKEKELIVLIILVGSRENIYKQLKRRV